MHAIFRDILPPLVAGLALGVALQGATAEPAPLPAQGSPAMLQDPAVLPAGAALPFPERCTSPAGAVPATPALPSLQPLPTPLHVVQSGASNFKHRGVSRT